MLLHLLPKLLVLLDAHLLARIELHHATEIHLLCEQRLDVRVESLPVRVLQVVSSSARSINVLSQNKMRSRAKDCLLLAGLLGIPLNDCEGTGILGVLHHKPLSNCRQSPSL